MPEDTFIDYRPDNMKVLGQAFSEFRDDEKKYILKAQEILGEDFEKLFFHHGLLKLSKAFKALEMAGDEFNRTNLETLLEQIKLPEVL